NMVSKQSKGLNGLVYNFSYSADNQLKKVGIFEGTTHKLDVLMTYDALGRRIKKQVIDYLDPAKSYQRKFAFDGDEVIAVFDENDSLLARYTHSGMRTDDVLGVEITNEGVNAGLSLSAGKYQFLKDALGSITDITDNAGNILQRYSYSSFGKILKIVSASGEELVSPLIKTHYAFTNREWDEEIGLYYYRARYYDASAGRFVQQDPHPGYLIYPGTFTSGYIYTLNNSVNLTDPKGKIAPIVVAMIIGAVISGVKHYNEKGLEASWSSIGSFVGSLAIGAAIGAAAYGIGALGAHLGAQYLAFGGSQTLGAFLGSFIGGTFFSSTQQYLTKGKVHLGTALLTGFLFGVGGAIGQGAKSTGQSPAQQNTVENLDAVNKTIPLEVIDQIDLGPLIPVLP
ncbi:MAG: RHS repeat domain-containing protein, partial [Bdellovibrionia bacterium]